MRGKTGNLLGSLALAAACFAFPAHAGESPVDDSPEVEAPSVAAPAPSAVDSGDGAGSAKKLPAAATAPATSVTPAGPAAEAPATAEPAIDSGDLVIEVDKNQSRNKDKSLPLALALSAVLPGAGEYYLGEKGKAKAFALVETGFWASLFVSIVAKDSYLESARNYASEFAGIDASGKDEDFLETMANYRAYQEKQHRQDSYELAQILSGKREQDYDIKPDPANYWDFGSASVPANTDHWQTFSSTLRYYRASKVAMSFAIGALALNRLASLANTLADYKRTSAKGLSLNVIPEFAPESAGARIAVRF
jgi:hypothetical protein